MKTRVSRWFSAVVAFVAVLGGPAHGQSPLPATAKVEPALDGIFAAFSTHPLVALGDRHGFSQLIEFNEAIIGDPRFAEDVGNATEVRSTTLQRDMQQCHVTSRDQLRFPETVPKALQDFLRAQIANALFRGDAILFVAPATDLTESPMFPDLYLNVPYRQEIRRRAEIQAGQPLPDSWSGIVPTTPVD